MTKFGCQLPQNLDFDRVIEVAKLCEDLSYDSVWAYDHLSPFWLRSGQALECWTTLAAVAARTRTVKVGSLVSNVNLRNPSLLAKMSSTLDNISEGRLIVGLGTGDEMSRKELDSYGYKFPSMNERVERLRETVLILKAMWSQDEGNFQGKHFKISHAANFPKPRQVPHPPIWIGGKHARLLDVVAELADGWNYWGFGRNELERRGSILQKKCVEYGRNPSSILKSWAGTYRELSGGNSGSISVSNIQSTLRNQTDADTRYFIASFGSNAKPEMYKAFAEAVKGLA